MVSFAPCSTWRPACSLSPLTRSLAGWRRHLESSFSSRNVKSYVAVMAAMRRSVDVKLWLPAYCTIAYHSLVRGAHHR